MSISIRADGIKGLDPSHPSSAHNPKGVGIILIFILHFLMYDINTTKLIAAVQENIIP